MEIQGDRGIVSELNGLDVEGISKPIFVTDREGPFWEVELVNSIYEFSRCVNEISHVTGVYKQPTEWVEKDLQLFANFLKVTIHVMYHHVMGKEGRRFTPEYDPGPLHYHVYLLKSNSHYHPIYKPFSYLRTSKTNHSCGIQNMCDYCVKIKGSSKEQGMNHVAKCYRERDGGLMSTVLSKFEQIYQKQHRRRFYRVRDNQRRLCCTTCGVVFEESLNAGEDEEEEDLPDVADADVLTQATDGAAWHQNNPMCTVGYSEVVLCTCGELVPVSRHVGDYHERYYWLNRHVCYCRVKELKMGDPSLYWVWDMECFFEQEVEFSLTESKLG